jgi:hypothetical protein
MKLVTLSIGLAVALTACSSSHKTSATAPPSSVAPAASSASTAGTLQGGYGDTKSNTGTTYSCELKGLNAADLKTVIDYVAVTGSGQSPICSLFEAQTNYVSDTSLTLPSTPPVCWMTAPDGASTARIYAPPGVSTTDVKAECAWQFQDLGR